MIILVTFLIIVLVSVSLQISRNRYNENLSYLIDKFYWLENNKAYSLLLHSIEIAENSFSAYSVKRKSFIEFKVTASELELISSKIDNLPIDKKCISCHISY